MAEGKKASLIVLGGPLAGTRCVLPDTGVVRVGSAEDSTLQIDLPGVSPLHARVVVEPGRVLVQEAGAERPLHVNDNPVEAAGTVLRNGDIIWLGMPGDADVVMLQCVLPRKQVEAAHSPEVTLAAVPMPVELPARVAPTPEIETTALRVPPAVASAPEPLPSEDELVFVDDSAPAPVEVQPITVDQVEVVEEAPLESTAHVVVSDFEKAVFVEPDVRQPVEPQEFEPEPTLVSADAPAFEDAVDESVEEAATIAATAADMDAPTVALPPPAVVVPPAPVAPEKPPAAPPASPHPERSYAGAPPVRRSPGASSPNVSQSLRTPQPPGVSQAVRPQVHAPQATHPPHVSHARHAPPRRSSGGSRTALLAVGGVGVLAVLGVGGFFAWRAFVARPTPAPAPSATPLALAQPTPAALPTAEAPVATPTNEAPVPELSPTPSAAPLAAPSPTPSPRATASPSPRATPSPSPRTTPAAGRPGSTTPAVTSPTGPSPAQQAAQAQSFVDQAEAALAARQYDAAVGHADGALRLEPGNARAGAVRAEAVRRRDLAHRRFVAGQTIVETQSKGGGIAGFDTGGADLRKAPDFQGRIEFEMSPGSGLEAGAAWTLRVFVVNDGKKPIRVLSLSIATRVNGSGSAANAVPRTREIAPQQRALVAETNGAWREGTTAWASEVSVTANKGDSLRNTLTWR